MTELFIQTVNLSIAAVWLILAAIILRMVFKKAPRWIFVMLWGIAGLRLILPFSFESWFGLAPSTNTFSAYNIQYETPAVSSGIPALNQALNPLLSESFAPNPAASVNPLYVWTVLLSVLWMAGMAAMLGSAAISYLKIRHQVKEKAVYKDNIYECDHIDTPFILGLLHPEICLPSGLDEAVLEPVIAHEKAHLQRRDHWWKTLGFLILCVYWFNPLVWAAYILFCRDIETSCDEKVIKNLSLEERKQYSSALVECSRQRKKLIMTPLAFGEVSVKQRIKNVLSYRKPARWFYVLAVLCSLTAAACFAASPSSEIAAGSKKLTLSQVIRLSEKKDALTWKDFEPYQGRDIGSGIHIMRYGIDDLFEVWVGGLYEEKPEYIHLKANNEAQDAIDLRTEDAAVFIEEHQHDLPVSVLLNEDDENTAVDHADSKALEAEQQEIRGGRHCS